MTGEHCREIVNVRGLLILCSTITVIMLPTTRAAAQGAPPPFVTACAACHPTETGPSPQNFGELAGLSEAYLLKQMEDYRAGRRKGDVMTVLASGLRHADLKVVAAHFASRKRVPENVVDAALAARGKTLYEEGNPANGVPNCVGCHGPSGGDSPLYPRLAGQLSSYTVQQMVAFKNGTRANDRARVMREMASRMTDDEIKAVAEYIAGLWQ